MDVGGWGEGFKGGRGGGATPFSLSLHRSYQWSRTFIKMANTYLLSIRVFCR